MGIVIARMLNLKITSQKPEIAIPRFNLLLKKCVLHGKCYEI